MAVVISSTTFTRTDIAGNRWVESHALVEFRDQNYHTGNGENLALESLMNQIEHIYAHPASGQGEYNVQPNLADLPANAGSSRLRLLYAGSAQLSLNVSGIPVSLLSGQTVSLTSGSNLSATLSGRILLQGSGVLAAGVAPIEVVSGTAVSGARALLHVLGH